MESLLKADEGPVIEIRHGDGDFVVVCEHASNRVPRALGTLGLSADDRQRHIAWDPGALDVAAGLAERLGATLVIQRYSRLVVDCNRDPALVDAITTFSEDTPIPGNVGLSPAARASRIAEVWAPFHEGLDRLLGARRQGRRPTALVTIHSFTPVYRGLARPWHVGIISTDERSLAEKLLEGLRRDPDLIVGDNKPYSAKDNVDYTIRRHGRDRNLPHAMVEIRSDLLTSRVGPGEWAVRLAELLEAFDLSDLAA